jgi:crotonobetainyl-CoA:carnitine CoA-transferase CaiB-like acyl-CoA transferase
VRALDGLKVLELSRVLAGPWCGMMLADLGADVIKLEAPDGDDTRALGPPFLDRGGEPLSAYFACCNRNKRSIALDLHDPLTRPLVDALLRWADVLIENFRTGTADALGVGAAHAMAINPRLVYCSISGYGREGRRSRRGGYDFVIQAEAGLMGITGPAHGEPSKAGVAVADLATGQNAAIAILAALRHRDATGRGQTIDVSLFDSQLAGLVNVASNVLFTGRDAQRQGNAHSSIVPYQSFRAADGEFVLAIASAKLWRSLCEAMQRPDWIEDPRCATNAARVVNREWICTELAACFSAQPVAHWLRLFEEVGVPVAPIRSVRAVLEDPLVEERGMKITIDGVPMLGSPLHLSDSPPRREHAPPRLGEHGDEIARALGIDPMPLRAAGAMR